MSEEKKIKDWLWEADCLMDELDHSIQERILHIAFAIVLEPGEKPGLVGPGVSCPFGQTFHSLKNEVLGYYDFSRAEVTLDLGNNSFPFFIRLGHGHGKGISLQTAGAFKNLKNKDSVRKCENWGTWYHFSEDAIVPLHYSDEDFMLANVSIVEESISKLCALMPDSMKRYVGGDLSLLDNWPRALLNIALRDINPKIQVRAWKSLVGNGIHWEGQDDFPLKGVEPVEVMLGFVRKL